VNIGQAADLSALPTKTIRYYEDIGLISSARRDNGYRDYGMKEVHELRFIARARGLGFTVEECRHLLELFRDKERASSEVREAAISHAAAIRAKIRELQSMERALTHLIDQCAGDDRPDCPILEELSREPPMEPDRQRQSDLRPAAA
jgi:MerR family transcriptional regulator, copper efflux regulator